MVELPGSQPAVGPAPELPGVGAPQVPGAKPPGYLLLVDRYARSLAAMGFKFEGMTPAQAADWAFQYGVGLADKIIAANNGGIPGELIWGEGPKTTLPPSWTPSA
jgi:hypothetical protein